MSADLVLCDFTNDRGTRVLVEKFRYEPKLFLRVGIADNRATLDIPQAVELRDALSTFIDTTVTPGDPA